MSLLDQEDAISCNLDNQPHSTIPHGQARYKIPAMESLAAYLDRLQPSIIPIAGKPDTATSRKLVARGELRALAEEYPELDLKAILAHVGDEGLDLPKEVVCLSRGRYKPLNKDEIQLVTEGMYTESQRLGAVCNTKEKLRLVSTFVPSIQPGDEKPETLPTLCVDQSTSTWLNDEIVNWFTVLYNTRSQAACSAGNETFPLLKVHVFSSFFWRKWIGATPPSIQRASLDRWFKTPKKQVHELFL